MLTGSVGVCHSVNDFRSHIEDELDRFDKLLNAGDAMNGATIQKMMTEVIEDRVAKERSQANTA